MFTNSWKSGTTPLENISDEESMWKREKKQNLLETSKMRDHMTWPRIHLGRPIIFLLLHHFVS